MFKSKWFFQLVSVLLLGLAVYAGYLAWQQFFHPVILVEWSTETEQDAAGFYLSRSESETEGFRRITPALIPAKGSSIQGGQYAYTDTDVEPGRVYYYQLDEMDVNGVMTPQGITEAVAQRGGLGELLLAVVLMAGAAWMVYSERSWLRDREGTGAEA